MERNGEALNVHLAKRLGIPVMIGDGIERALLRRLVLTALVRWSGATSAWSSAMPLSPRPTRGSRSAWFVTSIA